MWLLILAFAVSMVPAFFLYRWLNNQPDMAEGYQGSCRQALIRGMLSVIPVIACSAALHILGGVLHLKERDPILFQAYYDMIAIALVEEVFKFLAMKRVLRGRNCSWLEITVFMLLAGLGFEIVEAIPYAFGSSPIHMLVRGVTMMHVAMAFITGYFYGKSKHENDSAYAVCGFLLAWLMHGVYDFTLSPEVLDINDAIAIIPVTLAALSVVLLVLMIRFVRKARREEKYTEGCTE